MVNSNKEKYSIHIEVFVNINNTNECVMVFAENIVNGFKFWDYVNNGYKIITPATIKNIFK